MDTEWVDVGTVGFRHLGTAIVEVADFAVEARPVMIEVPRGHMVVEVVAMVLRQGMAIVVEVDFAVDNPPVMGIEALLPGIIVVVVGIIMAPHHWHGKEIVVGGDMEVVIGRGGDRAVVVLNEGEVDIDGVVYFLIEYITLIEHFGRKR